MTKVTFNGVVLADSTDTVVVEGNHYFPPSSVNTDVFSESQTHTVCPWKGTASYYNATVGKTTVNDVAWYYPQALDKAKSIEGYIAFYKTKVDIE
ncbi:hypothetical protein D9615_008891 [Tricholomella constricta]|uniref:DUF427 domain-containing protein n=1 Tax=Tricholomella constricta TaxID=117010 RepID=A0A8H5LYI7_9AGAR|nr:hypothetical protein D9615_008891 [Tricholomella constricta]